MYHSDKHLFTTGISNTYPCRVLVTIICMNNVDHMWLLFVWAKFLCYLSVQSSNTDCETEPEYKSSVGVTAMVETI